MRRCISSLTDYARWRIIMRHLRSEKNQKFIQSWEFLESNDESDRVLRESMSVNVDKFQTSSFESEIKVCTMTRHEERSHDVDLNNSVKIHRWCWYDNSSFWSLIDKSTSHYDHNWCLKEQIDDFEMKIDSSSCVISFDSTVSLLEFIVTFIAICEFDLRISTTRKY